MKQVMSLIIKPLKVRKRYSGPTIKILNKKKKASREACRKKIYKED